MTVASALSSTASGAVISSPEPAEAEVTASAEEAADEAADAEELPELPQPARDTPKIAVSPNAEIRFHDNSFITISFLS